MQKTNNHQKKKKKQNLFSEESVNYSSSPHMPILTDAKHKNAGLRERKRKQKGLHVSASAQAEYEGREQKDDKIWKYQKRKIREKQIFSCSTMWYADIVC